MHEDHDVSRRAQRKDTLSAEDLGILLQWHWKYGTATFAERASAGSNEPADALLGLHRQSASYAACGLPREFKRRLV